MPPVAIVTDSASDLTPESAKAAGVTLVPLIVSFGAESFRAGVELPLDAFYRRLLAPGAPFPTTAACSPGVFQGVFSQLLDEGADAVVCITVGGKLSGTLKAAQVARDTLPGRQIHVVDSDTATAPLLLLVLIAAEAARAGASAEEIVALVERRKADLCVYVVVETLEYLRRGGRITAAQAAIGSVLSVKPIITIANGVVETIDRPRTTGRARARLLELLSMRPVERVTILHTQAPNIDSFAAELAERTGVPVAEMTTILIGASVAPHVGPGAYGAALLLRGS